MKSIRARFIELSRFRRSGSIFRYQSSSDLLTLASKLIATMLAFFVLFLANSREILLERNVKGLRINQCQYSFRGKFLRPPYTRVYVCSCCITLDVLISNKHFKSVWCNFRNERCLRGRNVLTTLWPYKWFKGVFFRSIYRALQLKNANSVKNAKIFHHTRMLYERCRCKNRW